MAKTQTQSEELVSFVQRSMAKLSDKQKAIEMAAYMKTEMPFYGIQKPDRAAIYKTIKKEFAASTQKDYERNILALWGQRHREEKYAALEYAVMFKQFISAKSIPLYERLVREGAWWDFVDVIAQHMVGMCLLNERAQTKATIERFIKDDDMWIRRTAILSHNRHKQHTDERQLFAHALKLAHEKEFFIRKAIGWALREYAYVSPDAVRTFVESNSDKFSPLTQREALKRLNA